MRKLKRFFLSIIEALGRLVSKLFTRPWLKAYSGLFINISATFFIGSFIGFTVSFPQTQRDFTILFWQVAFGIIFLLLTVWCEKEIEK